MAHTNVRAASLEWIERTLDQELPGEYPRAHIHELAEAMLLMVEEALMPVEDLITWIKFKRPGKEWSQAELRAHIAQYCKLRKDLGLDPPTIQHAREAARAAATPATTRALCPRCACNVAVQSGRLWFCVQCGVIEAPAA